MRKVISSLDIGNNSVKLIVGEFTRGRLHILSAQKVDNEICENNKFANYYDEYTLFSLVDTLEQQKG